MLELTQITKLVTQANLKIDFVNYGIASRINDTIIYNKNLLKYDKLGLEVIDHEIRHTSTFTFKDFTMDLLEGSLVSNLLFSFRHPRAFTQFLPVGRYHGEYWVDVNVILTYIITMVIIMIWGFIFL